MINSRNLKKVLIFLLFVLVIFSCACLFYFIEPAQIIEYVGINNAYILMFIFAALAGVTSFNSAPYYYFLFLLSTTGFNPVYVGITAAVGLMFGDSFTYFFGTEGRAVIPKVLEGFVSKLQHIIKSNPTAFPLFCFLYGCVSPFSNSFLTILSGALYVPFFRIIIPLLLGNIIYNISIAHLSIYANEYIVRFFGS